jgi:heme exporter protein C
MKKLFPWLLWVVVLPLMFAAVWAAFVHAPAERIMGAVQRIFYFHVPSAIMTYAAVAVLLVASIAYLWTRRPVFDHIARAATEVSLLFCSLVLITGPIWAKPAWGVWWTWEARLTTTLVLWLLLAASLMVRGYSSDRDTGARLAAVLGIVAALDLPIIHKAVEWWQGLHPTVMGPDKDQGLAPGMREAFMVCMIAFFMLFVLLLTLRIYVASLEERAERLSQTLAGR